MNDDDEQRALAEIEAYENTPEFYANHLRATLCEMLLFMDLDTKDGQDAKAHLDAVIDRYDDFLRMLNIDIWRSDDDDRDKPLPF